MIVVSKVFPKKTQDRVPSRPNTARIKGMKKLTHTAPLNQRWLTTPEVCEHLSVSKNTYAKWRQRGVAPKAVRLPNGELRTRQDWLDSFLLEGIEVA
jgi:predicted DNA-binding transcriptional regulator AlpA